MFKSLSYCISNENVRNDFLIIENDLKQWFLYPDFLFFIEEFVAHGSTVNCVALSKKSGRVIVTGGEDRKVNLWIVGKPNCLMVRKLRKT